MSEMIENNVLSYSNITVIQLVYIFNLAFEMQCIHR